MKNILKICLMIGLSCSLGSCGKDTDTFEPVGGIDVITNNSSSSLTFYFADSTDSPIESFANYEVGVGETLVDSSSLLTECFFTPIYIKSADSIIVVRRRIERENSRNIYFQLTRDEVHGKNRILEYHYNFTDDYLQQIADSMRTRGISPIHN